MNVWRAIFIAAMLVCGPTLSTAGHAGATAGLAGGPWAASAGAAVRQAVEAGGGHYAGECATARSPEDLGKICSKLAAQQGLTSAYLTGRTFSEFGSWLFIVETSAGWCPAAIAPLDSTAMSDTIPWPAGDSSPGSVCAGAVVPVAAVAAAG